MARPRNADADATRARILSAASALFSARGSGAVTIRDVAAEARITLATVHHYFGTKEQLYDACIEAMYGELEALRSELEGAIPAVRSKEELVEIALRKSFRFSCAHRGALRLLMRTIVDAGELEPGRRATVHLPFLERAGAQLELLYGGDRLEMKLLVQSFMHLIVRYALTAPRELAMLVGINDEEAAVTAIEDHLVGLAKRTMQ